MRRLDPRSPDPDLTRRPVIGRLVLGTGALVMGLLVGPTGGIATAAPGGTARATTVLSNPTNGHPYRHGAVPLRSSSTPSAATNKPGQRVNAPRRTTSG